METQKEEEVGLFALLKERFAKRLSKRDKTEPHKIIEFTEEITPNVKTQPMENPTDKAKKISYRKEIDLFLSRIPEFEKRGYDDALVDSDTSQMQITTSRLKLEFEVVVLNTIRECKNSLRRNKDSGTIAHNNVMNDTELRITTENELLDEDLKEIKEMLDLAKENKGIGHSVVLAYEQGFKRALNARLLGNF